MPAARALWRGAPCLTAAELRRRCRGAAGARPGAAGPAPGRGRGRCGEEPPGCGSVTLEASAF